MNLNIKPGLFAIEYIAAEIWSTDKVSYFSICERIFTKCRCREVEEARMSVMLYRHEKLKQTQAIVSSDYHLEHGAVIHARKTINDLLVSDKAFREKYELFLSRVEKLPKQC